MATSTAFPVYHGPGHHRARSFSSAFRESRWVNRRVVWTTCGAITMAVASTVALVDFVSSIPGPLFDPLTGQLAAVTEGAFVHALKMFVIWAGGTFGVSSALGFAGMKVVGLRVERRVRPERRPLRIPVQVDGAVGSYQAASENISIGGLLLATEREHAVGDKISLRFQLPNQQATLSVEAEVRWIRRQGGVQGAPATGVGLLFLAPTWSFEIGVRRFLA